jgi:flagellar biogenesis protein FliO
MRRIVSIFALVVIGLSAVALADGDSGRVIVRDGPTSAPTAAAPAARTTLDMDSGHIALALSAVIGLILLLRSLTGKMFPGTIAGGRVQSVKVVARCPLAPRQQVLLVQVGRRVVVLGDSASQLSCLCQITEPDEVAALLGQIQRDRTATASSAFTSWFSRASDAFTAEEVEHAEPGTANADIPEESPTEKEPADSLDGLTARVRRLARQYGGPDSHA